jgi:hypothetical protein
MKGTHPRSLTLFPALLHVIIMHFASIVAAVAALAFVASATPTCVVVPQCPCTFDKCCCIE